MNEIQIKVTFDGREALGQLAMTDQNLKKITESLQKYHNEQKKMPQASGAVVQGNNAMSQSLGQLGWVLGDANMFMVNFRMGMMSVANNIPMVIQGFVQARQQAQALGQTFGQSLAASIMGPGGVMLGINALMFALQVLPQLFGKTEKAAEETKDKIKELAQQAEQMSLTTIKQRLTVEEIYLKQLEKQKASEILASTRITRDKEGYEYRTAGQPKESTLQQISATVAAIETYRHAIETMGIEQNRQNEIAEARNKMLKAQTETERQYWKNRIDMLEGAKRRGVTKDGIKIGDYSRVYLGSLSEGTELGSGAAMLGDTRAGARTYLPAYNMTRSGLNEVAIQSQPEVVNESTVALSNQLIVMTNLKEAYQELGTTALNGIMQSVKVFKQARNAGEEFVNILVQALTKMGTMLVVNTILGGLPSFMGIPGIASAMPRFAGGLNSQIINLNVSGEFKQSGTDLVAVVRRVEKLEKVYK